MSQPQTPAPHVMGSETEFGIVAVNDPEASPIHTSTQAVIAYAEASGQGVNRRTRWDYESESPLRDSRGFDLRRYRSGAAPVLDPNAVGAANVITEAGARFYVDHAHPEYSSPEVTSAWDAVVWDQAGDRVMHAAAVASGKIDGQPELKIYKNNVDGKGASYGAHENYLYPRHVEVERVHEALIPHFVTRQVFTGAGRVGLGVAGETPGFQVSQRADYIETEISLETTLNRGIVNTRDEPHATADQWRRLHVIIGDANLSQYATYLKFGTTALVLSAVAAGADFADLQLIEPVEDVKRVSRDLDCTAQLALYGSTRMTAMDIQREIRRRVIDALEPIGALTDDDRNVLQVWEDILNDLASDPLSTADRLDWTAKLSLLRGYRARGLEWSDPRMALIDIQYHDIDPAKGLHHALVARGRMHTLVSDQDVTAAVDHAPTQTRSWLRGALVKHYADDILAANWDSIIVNYPWDGQPATAIDLPEPLEATRADFVDTALEPLGERTVDASADSERDREVPGLADVIATIAHVLPNRVRGIG